MTPQTATPFNQLHTLIDVMASVTIEDGKVLLIQRETSKIPLWSLAWAHPGGKREVGETRAEALIREMREELNVDIYVSLQLHMRLFRTHGFPSPYRVFYYHTKLLGEPEAGDGVVGFKWVSLSLVKEMNILSGTVGAINGYQALVGEALL